METSNITNFQKIVHAWAFPGDCDTSEIKSNTFSVEWPPRSGRMREFPEIDRAAFFGIEAAKQKINPAQAPLVEELAGKVPSGRFQALSDPRDAE